MSSSAVHSKSREIDHAQFADAYFDLVENRTFVEYPEYYRYSVGRFWKAFDRIQKLRLPRAAGSSTNPRVIDIGGGIMALLLHRLLGFEASVGDVNRRAAGDVEDYGLSFQTVDLLSDTDVPAATYDLVVLQEVVEHLPEPPYVVFERIKRFMAPDSVLFLTTPNAARLRNLLYHLAGRQVLDDFRYPVPGEALGHQMEYTLPQLLWQLNRAGLSPLFAEHYDDGWAGATRTARLSHLLARPVNVVSHLRNGLVAAARKAPD